jgi:hypothetical protein
VPSHVTGEVIEQRILEQGARLRADGAVTGWASLRWHVRTTSTGLPLVAALGFRCRW